MEPSPPSKSPASGSRYEGMKLGRMNAAPSSDATYTLLVGSIISSISGAQQYWRSPSRRLVAGLRGDCYSSPRLQ